MGADVDMKDDAKKDDAKKEAPAEVTPPREIDVLETVNTHSPSSCTVFSHLP